MVEKLELFPVLIYRKKIFLDNKLMSNKLYELRSIAGNPRTKDSNPWQSDRNIGSMSEFLELSKEIKTMISEIFGLDSKILQMWGSIYENGQYNNIHNHPPLNASYYNNPLWVGVYYLKTSSNGGGLNIHSPVNPSNRSTFHPEDGEIYIFNSTTYHSVHPNEDESDRLSVAFNLELLNG
jgi:hypothetical protein